MYVQNDPKSAWNIYLYVAVLSKCVWLFDERWILFSNFAVIQ